jgi:hypothetical protein
MESAHVWVYDIRIEPKLMYQTNKGKDYVTDKFAVHKGHVVVVPSWPMTARAVIMTLSIENGMNVVGKFLYEAASKQDAIDEVTLVK